MKKLVLIISIALLSISCEKEYFIPSNEVPDWLKTKINKDEQIIKDSPRFMTTYGGWLRYNWRNEYYFEYHNILSSSMPRAISFNGDTLKIYASDINTEYYKEKCCKKLVWKAPKFMEYSGI